MTILIGIVVFICLIGFGFGSDAARGLVRLVLILAGFGAVFLFIAVMVEVSRPRGLSVERDVVVQRWGTFTPAMPKGAHP